MTVRSVCWGVMASWVWILGPASAAVGAEVEPGRFLIATEQLRGSVFGETVVLLLDYAPEGAVGLIVNRPLRAPLAELLPDVAALHTRDDRAWLGGPVAPASLLFLVRSDEPVAGANAVVPGVHSSRSLATLRALLAGARPLSFRLYAGYSGWGPGQLDMEIARGAWIVAPADWASVFEEDPASLWRRLLRRFQPVRVELQNRS